MLRKLAIAIAASGAMMSATNVLALGMGDIELESALNQPLDARIKLLKASELENWEMKPNLASSEEFEKSGVEHVYFLNNLKFEIERSGEDVYIHVTSNQAVVEPFLNFLVQVDWPNGRLLREYTLLLDPPVFTEEPVQAISPAQDENFTDEVAPESMSLPGTAPASSSAESAAASAPKMVEEKPALVKPEVATNDTYKVRANDTLWEVAIRTRAKRSISPQQAMLAIQDLNPNAFINGNINRLKKNQVLRVPSEEQMLSRSFDDAVSEVAIQNQAIAKRKAQLDATRKDKAMQRDDKLEGAQLKLLAGGEATTDNERNSSGQVAAKTAGDQSKLEKDLSITLENLDKTTRENQELRSRLDSLEDQINTLQRLINLKDEQMVALQSGMAKKPVMEEPAPLAEKPAMDATKDKDLNFADDAQPSSVIEKKAEPVKPKPKVPAYVPPVEEEFDPVAFVMENPPVLGAGLGALLLALLGINYARKRKEKQAEERAESTNLHAEDPLDVDMDQEFDQSFAEIDEATDLDIDGFEEGDLADFDSSDSSAGLLDGDDQGEAGEDVLGEVDVYLAYNRLDPAKGLLEKAIAAQPDRMDLRLKMLEVASGMDDSESLTEQLQFIEHNGSEADKAAASQFSAEVNVEDVNEDFSMDFGLDDELGLQSSGSNTLEETSDFSLNDEGDSDLDFDLDGLDLSDSSDSDAELDLSSGLDMDFGTDDAESSNDLDLEFDSAPTESMAADDLDLEFNTDVSSSDETADLDITLDNADTENSMDFDLGDFEASSDDISLDELDEPVSSEAEASLDELSLDASDDFDFDLNESDDETSLDFDLSEGVEAEIPQLSTDDDLSDLSFESDSESDFDELTLDAGDDTADIELGSSELSEDDALPDFEDGLSFDEEDSELPELTDDLEDTLDAELDALSGDDIELPTLEPESDSLDDLPELNDDFDLSTATTEESLESVEDVAAEYKQELPSLEDSGDGDDFPPLGDIDELDLENLDNDLDFLSGTDESETKLDLARAYIDMEDQDGAREILQEVLEEGSDQQKEEANKLLDSLV